MGYTPSTTLMQFHIAKASIAGGSLVGESDAAAYLEKQGKASTGQVQDAIASVLMAGGARSLIANLRAEAAENRPITDEELKTFLESAKETALQFQAEVDAANRAGSHHNLKTPRVSWADPEPETSAGKSGVEARTK